MDRYYVRLNFSIEAEYPSEAEMKVLRMLADAGIYDGWEIETIEPEED